MNLKLLFHFIICLSISCTFLAISTIFQGCKGNHPTRQLETAEAIIDENADSALSILQKIDTSSLSRESDKAIYNLLITQAKEKNFIAIENDSLITDAAEYFLKTGDRQRAMKALNYQGNIRRERLNDNNKAIISYLQAYHIATELDDKFWIGMTARGIADVYGDSFKGKDDVKYSQIAYTNMKESGRQQYIDYALLDLAEAYHTARDYEKAVKLENDVLDSARVHQDSYLEYGALRARALSYYFWRKIDKSIEDYEKVCQSPFANKMDSIHLTMTYAHFGMIDDAYRIKDSISDIDSFFETHIYYLIYESQKNYEKALHYAELSVKFDNERLMKIIDNNVSSSVISYFELEDENNRLQLSLRKWQFIIAVSAALIILVISGWIIRNLILRLRRNASEKLVLADQLESTLKENGKSKEVLQKILSTRYSLLQELCELVVTSTDSKTAQKKIVNAVTNLIETLSISGDKINELEKEMDNTHGNVCSNFKADFPNLKDIDYRLFLYSSMGLSTSSMMLLLKETKIEAVYSRKKRLKARIKGSDSPRKDEYLSAICNQQF